MAEVQPERHAAQFSPKELLKVRRPERFSDSVVEEVASLDRSILEYHLETLTNRSQETQFAIFARHLAEREICPNLLPQTGPTGGGDSKVDSETYPVADDIALAWHAGIGREGASERWGFAFSAKKKWRDKVGSDVDKAVKTGRGYKKVFFISNQFIRDKERGEVEDQLRTKHGLDVRLLDRTWILDKVFTNGHEALAAQDLQLGTALRREVRKGPLDTRREMQQKEIEERIQKAIQEGRFGAPLAEDCIESADLARRLERPRMEIDGLYDRAERVAAKSGNEHQRLSCAYQRAWTAFWWYEDYEQFSHLYEAAEQLAKGSRNAYHLELLSNLWSILHSSVIADKLSAERSALAARTETLSSELDRLCQQQEQPSAVLHARVLRLQMQLVLNLAAKEPIGPVLNQFQEVVRSCEGLAGFPLEPLVEILAELGEHLGSLAAYDELFELVVKVQSGRKADVETARMLLRRGAQKLSARQPYEAIRTLGLSLRKLYKHESRDAAVHALYLCGRAYESVGLLWAARGTLLSAASLATSEFYDYEKVLPSQGACYQRLKWLELQIGRVPHALSWHEVESIVTRVLADRGTGGDQLREDAVAFDGTLGLLFLRTEFWELKYLSGLPDVLEGLGLFGASVALMYALGYEKEVGDTFFPETGNDEDMRAFFLKWRDQPASRDVPDRPALYEGRKVTLTSRLLGCEISVETENVFPCVELAESILAALESLLSTGTIDVIAMREPTLTMAVRRSDFAKEPFEFELQDYAGRPHVDVLCCPLDSKNIPNGILSQLKDKLLDLLTAIIARAVIANDLIQVLKRLFGDERALDRSLNFTGSFVTVTNVLGHEPKNQISSWANAKARNYYPKRAEAWDAHDIPIKTNADANSPVIPPDSESPPPELRGLGRVKQNEIRTVSLIRESLWDKTTWVATVFATAVDGASPPILAIAFKDGQVGTEIFRLWRSELGDCDEQEKLRVVIVRGIDKANPHSYRVAIGSNPVVGFSRENVRYAAFVSRINKMEPDSSANLERFLRAYETFKCYFLMAAVWKGDGSEPELIYGSAVLKRQVLIRPAWEIGLNDLDGVAIQSDDTPLIPPEQKNPPVVELLRRKQERGAS
jgi:hypothetical protein